MNNVYTLSDRYLFVANTQEIKTRKDEAVFDLGRTPDSFLLGQSCMLYPIKNKLFCLWSFNPKTQNAGSLLADEDYNVVK